MFTKAPLTTASGLIDKLHIIEDDHIDLFMDELLKTKSQKIIGFLNQHGYNLAAQDRAVLESFSDIDYLLRDGAGIKLACKWNKLSPGANLNGTDFIPSLIRKANVSQVDVDYFVFGTQSPWLESGARKLMEGRACHTLNGFMDDAKYIEYILEHARPDALLIVVLAMGMPKQERIASMLRETVKAPVLVICGGAIIDFQADRFDRAPAIMRRLNLEWVYRLVCEPKRLFGRYILGIPKFFYYLALKK